MLKSLIKLQRYERESCRLINVRCVKYTLILKLSSGLIDANVHTVTTACYDF